MRTLTIQLIALLALLAVPAAAEVVSNESTPMTLNPWVPCAAGGAGEIVALAGDLHILTTITIDADGGIHMMQLFQPKGISGQGTTTGVKYQANGVSKTSMYMSSAGFPLTTTYVNSFSVIGAGSASNFVVRQLIHATINPDGTVTSNVDNQKVVCK